MQIIGHPYHAIDRNNHEIDTGTETAKHTMLHVLLNARIKICRN